MFFQEEMARLETVRQIKHDAKMLAAGQMPTGRPSGRGGVYAGRPSDFGTRPPHDRGGYGNPGPRPAGMPIGGGGPGGYGMPQGMMQQPQRPMSMAQGGYGAYGNPGMMQPVRPMGAGPGGYGQQGMMPPMRPMVAGHGGYSGYGNPEAGPSGGGYGLDTGMGPPGGGWGGYGNPGGDHGGVPRGPSGNGRGRGQGGNPRGRGGFRGGRGGGGRGRPVRGR